VTQPIGLNWKPIVYWLDNEAGPLSDYEDDCKKAFLQASRDLQVGNVDIVFERFSTGNTLLQKLNGGGTDGLAEIIGIDFSLDSDDLENGVKAVERIKSLYYPTDVIVYGVPSGQYEQVRADMPGWYGNVNLCSQKAQVIAALEAASRKVLVKWLDKEYIRGLIISRTTDIETNLDEILVEFYQIETKLRTRFSVDVLQADLLGFGKKITLLENILKKIPDDNKTFGKIWKKGFKKEISALSALRNEAAHGAAGMDKGEFSLTNRGNKKKYGRKELAEHFYNAYGINLKLTELKRHLVEITNYVLNADDGTGQE
jgi:hypothetical protein